MFVGVGATIARFVPLKMLKSMTPAIIFIDEIDAVGRQRGVRLGGGGRWTWTNPQPARDWDGWIGFETTEGIIVISGQLTVLWCLDLPFFFVLAVLTVREYWLDVRCMKGHWRQFFKSVFMLRISHLLKRYGLEIGLLNKHQDLSVADLENVLNEAWPWLRLVEIKSNWSCWYLMKQKDRVIAGPSKKVGRFPRKNVKWICLSQTGHTIVGFSLIKCSCSSY